MEIRVKPLTCTHLYYTYIKILRRETTIEILSQENFKKYILDDLVTTKGSFKCAAQYQ